MSGVLILMVCFFIKYVVKDIMKIISDMKNRDLQKCLNRPPSKLAFGVFSRKFSGE